MVSNVLEALKGRRFFLLPIEDNIVVCRAVSIRHLVRDCSLFGKPASLLCLLGTDRLNVEIWLPNLFHVIKGKVFDLSNEETVRGATENGFL